MAGNRFCTYALSVIIAVVASTPTFAVDRRPMSLDDMMKAEGLGVAAFDPSGRWLVYEHVRPYDQLGDYSFLTYASGKTGHQIWQYDMKKGGAPRPLSGIDPAPSSYLQGFSASGRFLAIMQYHIGAVSLGAYDMEQKKVVLFPQTPAYSQEGIHNPVWLSDDELMFAALSEDELPAAISVRAHTGRTLAKAWEDAWRGDVVTASEVRSLTQDKSDQQEPGYLVRANARTGQSRIFAEGLYADLRMSPDGRHLAALAVSKPRQTDPNALVEDDPRRYHLTVFDLDTGKARRLAAELEFFPYSITWAPDSSRVAVYGWPIGQGPRNGRFHVIDVNAGNVVRYDHIGLDLADERERGWYPRPERITFLGDALAVFARKIPETEDRTPRFTYQSIRPTNVSKADWYALDQDGSSRNLTDGLTGLSGVPVHAGKGHITVTASDGVYRLYADGRRQRLTPSLPGRYVQLSARTFSTESDALRREFSDEALFTITGDGATTVMMVDLRDGHEGQTMVVSPPSPDSRPLAGSLSAGAILFREDDGGVAKLSIAGSDPKRSVREIARINAHLANVDFGTWTKVSYSFADSSGKRPPQALVACVLVPPGHRQADAPLPMIVNPYPGVRPDCETGAGRTRVDGWSLAWSPYHWAGLGYAYARLATPNELMRTDRGPIDAMPDMLDAGVDALVKAGLADPKRVAVVGASQGGISALYAAARSEKYRAVIAMNSWADLFSHYFGANGVFSYLYGEYFGSFGRYDRLAGGSFGIGKTPFEDPDIYYRNSPVFMAPKISAPVLLIHSDMDGFSMSQFDEMYGALLRAGKDVRYVRYWGEGHLPSSPANIRDMWQRMEAFLIENGMGPTSQQLDGQSAEPVQWTQ